MTIVFQGHVERIQGSGTKIAVTLRPPLVFAGGVPLMIYVEREQAASWLPGQRVNFTINPIPESDRTQGDKS